jgi:DNA ligase-1
MEEVIRIFKEIQETSGKNDKQAIIARNQDNDLFKKCLVFLLDSNITTGISKSKINKKLDISDYITIDKASFEVVMDYIKDNNTGRDSDIVFVQSFIDNQPEEYREFYKDMITKSLTLGCDYKTVNKVIPNLIRTWEVQLGSPIDKCKIKKGEWFSLSQKLNGNRCSYYRGKLVSRQGKEFKGFQHIIDDIKRIEYSGYFIDGELIRKNVDCLTDGENFRCGTGIINSDADTKEEIELVIFDLFPVSQFDEAQSTLTYKDRIKYLEMLEEDISKNGAKNIRVVKRLYQGTDQSEIEKWLQYAVDNDWEGIMLNKDDYYRCKRVTSLCKIKRFYTMDLKVVDVFEGDGRLKNTLGALVVEFKGNTVNVGSGYSDEQRTEIWISRDDIVGKIIEVKYKEITSDKNTGLESLQFPVFVRIRSDKTEPSYN